MTVLGTLLVLSGATIIILRAWDSLRPVPAAPDAPAEGGSFTADAGFPAPAAPTSAAPTGAPAARLSLAERGAGTLLRLGGADRLIAWGILLLLLASIASGAIGFQLGASANTPR
jgi:hypothetical protein